MTLRDLFFSSIRKYAGLEAIVEGARRITYQELQRQALCFQAGLRKLGVKRGETVGLLLPNSIEFVVTYYAVSSMGNTVIPLNTSLTSEELAYICADAGMETLVCHTSHEPMLSRLLQKTPRIKNVIVVPSPTDPKLHSFAQWVSAPPQERGKEDITIEPEEIAAILYTSGTTGKPKGAMLTHKNLAANARAAYETLACSHDDSFLVALPLFHAFQATVGMLTPMLGGCKIVIAEFKPAGILELLEKEKLTFFLGVPSMYLLLTRHLQGEERPKKFFRLCISGGAALPVSVAQDFEKKFKVPVHEGYGLTEAAPVCTVNPIHLPPKIGSIGLPIKGVQIRVVDESGSEIPRNQVGELVVKGDNVMKGYYRLPEETAKTIRDGWLFTGDLARQDEEGFFYIVDRKKEMIIVAGENVYPREVEEVLFAHPEIAEAAVVGAPDELRGEVPTAFIRLKENAKAKKRDILNYCKEYLAPYKIPRDIQFVEQFPKNATGKILKKELRQLMLQQ